MSDDGWEDVTDPLEVKKILGVSAARAMGGGGSPGGAPQGAGLTPSARARALGQNKAMNLINKQLDRVEQLYKSNLKGVGLQSVAEFLPTPENKRFNAASNALLPLVRSALSTGAKDSDSDKELSVWARLIPSHDAYDTTNEERIATLRRMSSELQKKNNEMLGVPAAPTGLRVIGIRKAR